MEKPLEISKTNGKEILVQRMFFAIGCSIVVHFVLMSGVLFLTNLKITHPLEWIQNTWNLVTCLRMWTCFLVFSIVVFLKGIVCGKDYLVCVTYAPSRFIKFCHLFTPHKLSVGALYTLFGGVLAWLHLSVESGRYSSLLKYCKNSSKYCLVEEYYFLLLEGFWAGLYFFTHPYYFGSRNIQFFHIPVSKFSQVKRGIFLTIPNAVIDALWPTIYFYLFYFIFGNYCRNFVTIPFSLSIDEEPLNTFSRLFDIYLFLYAWLHGILFILITQSMHILFQAYLTEWLPFIIEKTQLPCNNNKLSLSDALVMDKIPILQQLGYLDLITIAQRDKSRRAVIFTLSQPGGHPYNWNSIVEKCLALIKKFSEGLDSAISNKVECIVENKNIAVPSTHSADNHYVYNMRSLVSSSEIKPPTECNANRIPEAKLEESFIVQALKNLRKSVVKYLLSKPIISYIFGEQFESKIRHVFRDAQSTIWAADAISSLAVVSLEEDGYGVVQKDLTNIIESLLTIKSSLDKIQKLNISIRKPLTDDKYLKQTMNSLRSAVRRSIYRIICHFKQYVDDLGLPKATVEQLQPFFAYRE